MTSAYAFGMAAPFYVGSFGLLIGLAAPYLGIRGELECTLGSVANPGIGPLGQPAEAKHTVTPLGGSCWQTGVPEGA